MARSVQKLSLIHISERIVHAKGCGAFGTFTVTNYITRYTKAAIFYKVRKKTDLFARFSTVAGERGAADTAVSYTHLDVYKRQVAEWSIAAVLKTVDCHRSGGSNPSLSAENQRVS